MKIVIVALIVVALVVVALVLRNLNLQSNTRVFRGKVNRIGKLSDEGIPEIELFSRDKYDSYAFVNDGINKNYYAFDSVKVTIDQGTYGEFKVRSNEVVSFKELAEDN